MNNREETNKNLDKIISTAHDIKRKLSLLSDEQCLNVFHQKSHEVIDDRMTILKTDVELFIHINSMINKFLEVTEVNAYSFFKRTIDPKPKAGRPPLKPRVVRRHGKIEVVDARRVFCYLFPEKKYNEAIARYINTSRSSVIMYKRTCKELILSDKKFKEYYERIVKKLNLGFQTVV
jgi:hypothetical protein